MEAISSVLELADQTEVMLSSSVPSTAFQIQIKSVSGKTYTIDDVESTTTILEIMKRFEAKDGLPVSEQRLVYRGKELIKEKTAADFSVERDSTLFSLMRLKGGLGERATMDYTIGKEIHRGNLKNEIAATGGASSALKNWGRAKVRDPAFWEKIRKKLKMDRSEFADWKRDNRVHVYAMIQETTHGGNCGDFSQVVHSRLVSSTTGQWVYQIVMTGKWPDKYQYDEEDGSRSSHGYDHQLCLTYPTEVSSLSAMDPLVATIADGWDNYKVCTLQSFIDGNNAYGHEMGWANLKIVKKEECTGEGPPPKVKSIVVDLVSKDLDSYLDSKRFTADKKKAMEKVDAGYNFGTRHAPIPDEVDDDRTTEDIARQLDAITDDGVFATELESLADHQAWNYYAISKASRDNVLKTSRGRAVVYALFVADNDSDFAWAMDHMEDDQFFSFYGQGLETRDRVLSLERTRSRLFRIFNDSPNGLVAGQCSWIGEDHFLAYFKHSADCRDKILGASTIYTLLYEVLEKQSKSDLETLCALMTDEQLQAYADSSDGRQVQVSKSETLQARIA